MDIVHYVDDEKSNNNVVVRGFPSMEEPCISNFPNLEQLLKVETYIDRPRECSLIDKNNA
ncbi:hypothetical protein MTR_3g098950 [Medicago truncatula]|uniref:Uncharacterized protein n=1 Tax=Medicago truncatula TaxID=3880 RepID=G7J3D2_MEDTR|nr:hypothetical protein MTR_3g098950 [Medicago truncatula]